MTNVADGGTLRSTRVVQEVSVGDGVLHEIGVDNGEEKVDDGVVDKLVPTESLVSCGFKMIPDIWPYSKLLWTLRRWRD